MFCCAAGGPQVRFSHVDLASAQYLDIATGQLHPRSVLLRKLSKTRSRDRSDKDKGA